MSEVVVTHPMKVRPAKPPRLGVLRTPFISVAFMAAIVFGPLVIVTGLMTTGQPAKPPSVPEATGIDLSDLRSSLDMDPPRLRTTED